MQTKYLVFSDKQEGFKQIPPGGKAKIKVADTTVCLINLAGTFHAVANSCPHLGESLAKGTLNYLGEIVCPWHAYRFNIRSGEETMRRCGDLRVYRIIEEEGGVYIEM